MPRWLTGSFRARGDCGQALLVVLGLLAVLGTVPVVVVATTNNQLPLTTNNLNWNGAYEAAQAGLNDYLQHLDANSSYTQYTRSDPDSGNGALSGWQALSTAPNEWYTYSPSVTEGHVELEVSGAAGTGSNLVIRTFFYTLQLAWTGDFAYWTDYESLDPSIDACDSGDPNYGKSGTDPPLHYPGVPSSCYIYFYGDSGRHDELFGPVFSDDTFQMECSGTYGPVFDSTVQSGNTGEPTWVGTSCSDGATTDTPSNTPNNSPPTFNDGAATTSSPKAPPVSTSDVYAAENVGCYITGNGGNYVGSGVTVSLTPGGFTWTGGGYATLSSQLTTTANQTSVPITALTNSISSGDSIQVVNGSNTLSLKASASASAGATSIAVNTFTPTTTYPAGSTVTDVTDEVIVNNKSTNPNSSGGNTYCGSTNGGTVQVSKLDSALFYVNGPINVSDASGQNFSGFLTLVSGPPSCTISSANPPNNPCGVSGYNINVTGNITYPPSDITNSTIDSQSVPYTDPSDALGLLAQNSVIVAQPTSGENLTIDAALDALSDSFYVKNWGSTPAGGTLSVFGSIAQSFRGAVGTFSGDSIQSGYTKAYYYDESFQNLWPPYFLPPAGATWYPLSYVEFSPGCAASVVPASCNP